MQKKSSRISGFYKKTIGERLEFVKEFANLSDEDINLLSKFGPSEKKKIDRLIENVIGVIDIPLGLGVNFKIDDEDYIIPMAVEESSVVAAASNAAQIARKNGGFYTSSTGTKMIAQIQAVNIDNPAYAKIKIIENKEKLLKLANKKDPILIEVGGGAEDIEVRIVDSNKGPMVITHLIVDTKDAMGANAVNTMAEEIAPIIEELTNGKVYLRILTNLADKRIVRSRVKITPETIGGKDVIEGILTAHAFAEVDSYRAATHNKGIMNGIIPVVVATGNDSRAIEAGAHAYASKYGNYKPLTTWEKDKKGNLNGILEIPMAVGLIGGATANHPVAKLSTKILNVNSAEELGRIIGAVGLAQNLTALKALATEGIQKGHMSLHAKNVASMAGADEDIIDEVAEKLKEDGNVNIQRAKEIIENL